MVQTRTGLLLSVAMLNTASTLATPVSPQPPTARELADDSLDLREGNLENRQVITALGAAGAAAASTGVGAQICAAAVCAVKTAAATLIPAAGAAVGVKAAKGVINLVHGKKTPPKPAAPAKPATPAKKRDIEDEELSWLAARGVDDQLPALVTRELRRRALQLEVRQHIARRLEMQRRSVIDELD